MASSYQTNVTVPEDYVGYVIGYGSRTIDAIGTRTNTYINKIPGEPCFSIQGEETNCCKAKIEIEEMVLMAFSYKTNVTVPEDYVGYVRGKGSRTINAIGKKTKTSIRKIPGEPCFSIQGDERSCYNAKIEIKHTVWNGRRKKLKRLPWVDSREGTFHLRLPDQDDPFIKLREVLRIVSSDNCHQEEPYGDCSVLSEHLLDNLKSRKAENLSCKVWCHFGRVFITNYNHDKDPEEFNLQDLSGRLNPESLDARKWRSVFIDGFQKNNIDEKLSQWKSRADKCHPFFRTDFTYLTPSCREMRIKVFADILTDESGHITYQNAKSYVEVGNTLMLSDTYPYFYVCATPARSLAVDILEPHSPLDIRLLVETTLQRSEEDELLKDANMLYEYVRQNLNIKPDGTADLNQEAAPPEFDLIYSRISERKTYSIITDDTKERFTVRLSSERAHDIGIHENGETVEKVDIHLNYDDWETNFKDKDWEPQQIVDKLPVFMKCARSLARTLNVEATVPPEILARGPKALRAYRKALTSGSTKNNQVLLMFIGQSRVGKTSLLRSLKGQQFNPNEDSTPGVKVERSLSKQKGDQWLEEGNDELFDISTANEIAGYLNPNENNGVSSEKALVHQESEEKFFRDDNFREDNNEYSENSIPSIAKSASHDEAELLNTGIEDCLAVPVEKEEKIQPSYTETTSEIRVPPNVTETVTKILRNDRMEDDNYSYITFDFAGQPVYSATHPVFFSSKAIYILVYSLEDKLDDQANPIFKQGCYEKKLVDRCPMTNMDHIEFWLSFVQSASVQQELGGSLNTNKDMNLCHFQPVFLVGTHADKPFDNDNPANLAQKVLHRLEGKANADSQCLVRKIYTVNNRVSGSGQEDEDVKKLRDDILEEVEKLPYINEDIPIRWLRFKSDLSSLVKSSKKRYLSLVEAKEIASKCTINGEDEFDTLLSYLHDLKSIIYFENTKLVIIDIQWLLDVFVKVITVQPYIDWDVKYKESWRKLEENGILEKTLVVHLWHDLVDEVNTIDSLLLIMERFSIICQWNDVYLVPSMMNCDARGTGDLVEQNFKSPLVILFKSPHLPLGIFPRLLVKMVEMCKDKLWCHTPQTHPQILHNFCRFFDVGPNGCYDVVFTSDMRTITVDVIEEEDVDKNFDSLKTFCRLIMQFLTETLTNMKQKFPWKGCEDYQFCIRCPICIEASESCGIHKKKGCSRDSCQHLISESELSGGRTPRCRKNPTKKNVSIKQHVYSKWFPHTKKSATKQIQLQETSLTSNSHEDHLEIVRFISENQLSSISASEASNKVAEMLHLDKVAMEDPSAEIVKKVRNLCRQLKHDRVDIVKELRKTLPSGMTGPLCEDGSLVENMDTKTKEELTQALSGRDKWKPFAELVGLSSDKIEFYDKRTTNPAFEILKDHCNDWSVEKLYDAIVECGANAIADSYL